MYSGVEDAPANVANFDVWPVDILSGLIKLPIHSMQIMHL